MKKTYFSILLITTMVISSSINIINSMVPPNYCSNTTTINSNNNSEQCAYCDKKIEDSINDKLILKCCGGTIHKNCAIQLAYIDNSIRISSNVLCTKCKNKRIILPTPRFFSNMPSTSSSNSLNQNTEEAPEQNLVVNTRNRENSESTTQRPENNNSTNNTETTITNNSLSLSKKLASCGLILGIGYFAYKYFLSNQKNKLPKQNPNSLEDIIASCERLK